MYQTVHQGVLFVEGAMSNCRILKPISVELGGMLIGQSQLKTLQDVKDEMALQAKHAGGNAIINFSYGQKSVGFWRSLLQLDDVNWYGNGHIALIQ